MATKDRTSLLDFGMGMLMGLVRADHRTLNEIRIVDVHKGFVEAFKVVEAELGSGELAFWMTTNQFHGTSPDVDNIFRYWLSTGYVRKDAPGTVYRFEGISKEEADNLLATLDGGAELYDKAVATYIEYVNTHFTS